MSLMVAIILGIDATFWAIHDRFDYAGFEVIVAILLLLLREMRKLREKMEPR